jgi:hypothetical protein
MVKEKRSHSVMGRVTNTGGGNMAARLCIIALLTIAGGSAANEPFFESELTFPLEHWHNH